jgi:hypothetical protein
MLRPCSPGPLDAEDLRNTGPGGQNEWIGGGNEVAYLPVRPCPWSMVRAPLVEQEPCSTSKTRKGRDGAWLVGFHGEEIVPTSIQHLGTEGTLAKSASPVSTRPRQFRRSMSVGPA